MNVKIAYEVKQAFKEQVDADNRDAVRGGGPAGGLSEGSELGDSSR